MDRNKVTELMILDAVGCTNESESKDLQKLQKTKKDFPWSELADYQETVSLIPSVLSTETPSLEIKKSYIHKMDSLFNKEEKGLEAAKLGPGVQLISFEPPHNISSKQKVDWRGLSLLDSKMDNINSQNETEDILPSDKKGFVPASKRRLVFEDDHFETHSHHSHVFEIAPEKIIRPSKNFRKYFVAASIIIISGLISGYFLLKNNSQVVEVKKENVPIVSSAPSVTEDIITDSLIAVNLEDKISQNPKEELQTKNNIKEEQQIKKITADDLLTNKVKAPKPPEPIQLNMIEPAIDIPVENTQETEQAINPPKEQISEIKEEPSYFVAVEEMPEPIGGITEIQKKIEYPEIAKRLGLEGKVFIRAYVDETGTVTKAEVVKGIGGGCDEAAIDAILKTKFNPGKQRGKPIKVQITIPVSFKR
jgi:protein TonB